MEHIRSNLFWNFGEHLHSERGFCIDGVRGKVAAFAKCEKRFREYFMAIKSDKLTPIKPYLEFQVGFILMRLNRYVKTCSTHVMGLH